MAQTESKIRLIFEGAERGVAAAAAKAGAAVRSLGDNNERLAASADRAGSALVGVGKGMALLSGAGAAVKVVGATAGAIQQLAPAALLLPGVLLAGAAAMQTFKLATAGFGDAVSSGLSGDMKAFAEATKDMHPEMRKAAVAVASLKPQVDDLKKTVQGRFWDGFAEPLKKLGQTYLPILKTGLGDVSGALGAIAWDAGAVAQSDIFQGNVKSILADTTTTLKNMRPALGDALSGFLGLAAVGSTKLPRLGTAISDVSARFKKWVDEGVKSGSIDRMIDGAIEGFKDLGGIIRNIGSTFGSIFRGLGADLSSPLARIKELTRQVAEFMKTAAAQDGLRALGETLRVVGEVVGRVVMTALRELMPTLVALAPVAQQVARTLGDMLVNALTTLGPIIRGIASVLGEFPGVVTLATTAVVGFVAAVKAIQAVNAVSNILGLGTAIGGVGDKAKAADGKVAGFAGRLGGLKGAGAAAGLALVATAMDDINTSAAGGAQKLQGFEENLHDIVGAGQQILSLDIGGIVSDISSEVEQLGNTWSSGRAPVQQWSTSVGEAAQSAFDSVAGFFRRVAGLPPLPPVKLDVDTSTGQARTDEFVGGISRRKGTIQIDGDIDPVTGKTTQAVKLADGSTGVITIDGNPSPVTGQIHSSIKFADGSTGTIKIDGDRKPVNGKIDATVTYGNGKTTTIQVNAATAAAQAAIARLTQTRTMTIRAIVQSRALPPGHTATQRAHGGPIHGPGTGTSDTAGLFALSNGEHVLTAKEVRNAGGHGAIERFRAALASGRQELSAGRAVRGDVARTAMSRPRTSGRGGGVQLTVAPGSDAAVATMVNHLIRVGKINAKVA